MRGCFIQSLRESQPSTVHVRLWDCVMRQEVVVHHWELYKSCFFFVVVIFFVLVVQQFFGGVMFLWIAGVFCEVLCWFYCSCWVFVSSDGFMFSTLGPLYFTHDKVCYRETLKPKFSPAGSVCASHDNLVGNGVSVWNVCMCVSWKRKTLWSSLWKFKKCCWAAVC